MKTPHDRLGAVEVTAEWRTGARTPGWDRLWHRILFAVIDDSQPEHRQTASAVPVPEESPREVNDDD